MSKLNRKSHKHSFHSLSTVNWIILFESKFHYVRVILMYWWTENWTKLFCCCHSQATNTRCCWTLGRIHLFGIECSRLCQWNQEHFNFICENYTIISTIRFGHNDQITKIVRKSVIFLKTEHFNQVISAFSNHYSMFETNNILIHLIFFCVVLMKLTAAE